MLNVEGMSLLVVVIILGSALLIMSLNSFITGLGEREGGVALQEGGEALAAADGCMNETLLRIHRNSTYGIGSGAIPFTLPNGSCTIQVSDLGGGNRQIDSQATVDAYTKHIRESVSISGSIVTPLSWEERGD